MYFKKNIIYIFQYDFENGEPIKNRYLIVIDNEGDRSLVLSVVTSRDAVPEKLLKHGCVNQQDIGVHCHIFLKDIIIGENGFSFPLNSFIYISSSSVFETHTSKLNEKYAERVQLKDALRDVEFEDLIYCIYKSKFIPRGIKRKLEKLLNEIGN